MRNYHFPRPPCQQAANAIVFFWLCFRLRCDSFCHLEKGKSLIQKVSKYSIWKFHWQTWFARSFGKYRLDTLNQSLNGFDQVCKRGEIDRRASHFSEIDVAEKLEDGQTSNCRVVLRWVVENVIQYFDHLRPQYNNTINSTHRYSHRHTFVPHNTTIVFGGCVLSNRKFSLDIICIC